MAKAKNGARLLYKDWRPMRHGDIYRALGLDPKAALPVAGFPSTLIQGVVVRIEAKIAGKNQDGERTRACCPACGRWFGFARLRQHFAAYPSDVAERAVVGMFSRAQESQR